MIAVSNLAKSYGERVLFSGVSLTLNPGERYGVVGANGSGKSTLLRILTSEEEASGGAVSIPKRLRLGFLRQDHFLGDEQPIIDVTMMGHEPAWKALAEKERLLAAPEDQFDAERFSELEETFTRHDGYGLEARAGEVLEGLGIPTEIHRQPLGTLSGGFKLRVLLAQALAADPDALLLDEPTNHLDILSIRWLEKFLLDYAGVVMVVSHDHRFLDNVSSQVLDVDYETITQYPGNYQAFVEAKQAHRDRKEHEIAKQERYIAEQQAFIDRFKAKATKARQAQSKKKLVERVQVERLPQSSRRYPVFSFQQCRPSGREAVKIEDVSKSFGDNHVLNDVSLIVQRGDRLAVIGPNGIGKSTLLKILVGDLEADGGEVTWGYETHPGYFAQDLGGVRGAGKATVLSWLWEACPGESVGFVRGRLGRVLFSSDEVEKKLGALSGGEAARLAFARLSVEQPNVLVLDEPTNHLDLEAIEALVTGLESFEGTIILVSHDRWFVSRVASRILEIKPDGVQDFVGSYDEYVAHCGDDHLDVEVVLKKSRKKQDRGKVTADKRKRDQERSRRRKEVLSRHEVVVAEIQATEPRIREIDDLFCRDGFFDETPRERVKELQDEHARLCEQVDRLMAEWEELETALSEMDG